MMMVMMTVVMVVMVVVMGMTMYDSCRRYKAA